MSDDLDLPEFLRRPSLTPEAERAELDRLNAKARQEAALRAPTERQRTPTAIAQEERRLEKSRVRIEKLLAKRRGETTAMPKVGKAAMEVIMQPQPGPKERALREQRTDETASEQSPEPVKKKRTRKPPGYGKPIPPMRIPDEPEATAPATEPTTAETATEAQTEESKVSTKRKSANGNARKPVKGKTKAKGTDVRPGTKLEAIVALLSRPEGCTTAEVLKATGWPTVSMPAQAKAAGLKLKKAKDGSVYRYRAA